MLFHHYKINIIPKLFFSYVNGRLKGSEITCMHCPYFIALGEHTGVTMADLSRSVHCDKSNTSRILKELAQSGYAEIVEDETDRRVKRIFLTDKGQQYLKIIKDIMEEWNQILFCGISKKERQQVDAIVDKIILNAKEATNNYRDEAEDTNV